jgi:O-antigen ligase
MSSSVRSKGSTTHTFSVVTLFPILAVLIALLTGAVLGLFGPYAGIAAIGALIFAVIVLLRQDELAAAIAIAVHIYIDWYVGLRVVALLMVLMLLSVFFLARSRRYPWAEPRALWLWALLLALAIFPSIRGTLGLYDTLLYFPNVFFAALIFFWLGTVIARSTASVHRLFKMLAAVAALLAVHTLIEAKTGTILFAVSDFANHFGNAFYYDKTLGTDQVYRLASFFIDPNWSGAFFAMMLFLPLGVFTESHSFLEKALACIEIALILFALLFTFSAGAWTSGIVGLVTFLVFVGQNRYRVLIPSLLAVVALVMVVWLPSQVSFLLQHASDPSELSLRNGIWQTALRVIAAYPLTGVGLSILGYAQRVEPFLVQGQTEIVDHPHDSYLELGAMAGLPVLFTFVALILFALWLALRNWAPTDARERSLLAGGIAAIVALTVNSVSINAWTLPPLAATGWLILGAISSPLLAKRRKSEVEAEDSYRYKESL